MATWLSLRTAVLRSKQELITNGAIVLGHGMLIFVQYKDWLETKDASMRELEVVNDSPGSKHEDFTEATRVF